VSLLCPHCDKTLDQSEPREWHSLYSDGDHVDTECEHCEKPIRVTAFIDYSAEEVE